MELNSSSKYGQEDRYRSHRSILEQDYYRPRRALIQVEIDAPALWASLEALATRTAECGNACSLSRWQPHRHLSTITRVITPQNCQVNWCEGAMTMYVCSLSSLLTVA